MPVTLPKTCHVHFPRPLPAPGECDLWDSTILPPSQLPTLEDGSCIHISLRLSWAPQRPDSGPISLVSFSIGAFHLELKELFLWGSLICIDKNNTALDPKWKDIMIQGEEYMALAPVTVSRKSYKRERMDNVVHDRKWQMPKKLTGSAQLNWYTDSWTFMDWWTHGPSYTWARDTLEVAKICMSRWFRKTNFASWLLLWPHLYPQATRTLSRSGSKEENRNYNVCFKQRYINTVYLFSKNVWRVR